MTSRSFTLQMSGYSLTTAEILYRLPDHPSLLQSFIWQQYDIAPRFPRLMRFLDYWDSHLDGPLYQVRVAHKRLIAPREYRFVDGQIELH